MENKLKSSTIPIKKLATGDHLSINVIEIEGASSGQTCYIQASVHGAEIQGNLVIKQLLDCLKTTPINGRVNYRSKRQSIRHNSKVVARTPKGALIP